MKKILRQLISVLILLTQANQGLGIPIPDKILYGKVFDGGGSPAEFSEVVVRLNGQTDEKDEQGQDRFPVIARSGSVDDPEAGEIYVLRIPRDEGSGIQDPNRIAAKPGDKLFILVDNEVVDETKVDGIEVTTEISDVKSENLNGPDCEDLKDCDGDGLLDSWEQQIIDADPDDAIVDIKDVLPDDDFDGDGFTNLDEFTNKSNPTVPDGLINTSTLVYEVIAADSETCLESSLGVDPLIHTRCTDESSQLWRFETVDRDYFRICPKDGGSLCLTIDENSGEVFEEVCAPSNANQLWSVERDGDLYHIVSASNGQCIMPEDAGVPDSPGIVAEACGSDPSWALFPETVTMVYEDGEDASTSGWEIYDSNPQGARVAQVTDDKSQDSVIQLSGAGIANGYWLRNRAGNRWGNVSHFMLSWDMRFAESFIVFVELDTTDGRRYLHYTTSDTSPLGDGEYITHGLGSNLVDDEWHTIARNLEADLHAAQPDVDLLEVNRFLIRGSGRLDNVELTFDRPEKTVYEDGEDGTTNGWDIYDNDPAVAVISNVFDQEQGSQVIELSGAGVANGYRLRNGNGTPWGNNSQFALSWDMRFINPFIIYIELQTTHGRRYLHYTTSDVSPLGDGEYITHGLGSALLDDSWHTVARSLEADLHAAQPDVDLLEVNAFLIRGAGRIDNVELAFDMPQDTIYEDGEDGTTNGWDIYDNDPAVAVISNVFDDEQDGQVIELSGAGVANGYRLRNADSTPWENNSQFALSWDMRFAEPFIIYIELQTTHGRRYLHYTTADTSPLGDGEYITHGLGSSLLDDGWHTIDRDLEADLHEAQPDIDLLEVNAFLIRGTGRIDNILLR